MSTVRTETQPSGALAASTNIIFPRVFVRILADEPFLEDRPAICEPGELRDGTSSDAFALIASATRAAHQLWRDGYRYAKAGIILFDLSSANEVPENFFPSRDPTQSAALMRAMDGINLRYGTNSLRPGTVGRSQLSRDGEGDA